MLDDDVGSPLALLVGRPHEAHALDIGIPRLADEAPELPNPCAGVLQECLRVLVPAKDFRELSRRGAYAYMTIVDCCAVIPLMCTRLVVSGSLPLSR